MRRLWETVKLVRRHLRHNKEHLEWTQADADALRAFLGTAAGIKMRRSLGESILAHAQEVVSNGGSEFECGALTGMRTLLVSFEALATAGVAPEDDQSYE